jgi:hypothetical protein
VPRGAARARSPLTDARRRSQLLWVLITLAVVLSGSLPSPFVGYDTHVCLFPVASVLVAQSVVVVIITSVLVHFLWSIKEPFFIRQELALVVAPSACVAVRLL